MLSQVSPRITRWPTPTGGPIATYTTPRDANQPSGDTAASPPGIDVQLLDLTTIHDDKADNCVALSDRHRRASDAGDGAPTELGCGPMPEQRNGHVTDVTVSPAVVPQPSDRCDVARLGPAKTDSLQRRHWCKLFHQ